MMRNLEIRSSAPADHPAAAPLSDEECLRRVGEGDRKALAAIFSRYSRIVLGVARRILRDAQEAEDLMQSVFLEIQQKAHQFDARRGSARTWILQYAYHRSFNRKKYLGLRGYFAAEEINQDQEHGYEPCGFLGLNDVDRRQLVAQGLAELSRHQRRALERVFLKGYTLKEWARESGRSYGNVRHDYYRGLEKLRDKLCGPSGPHGERGSGENETKS